MSKPHLRTNPNALPDVDPPRIGRYRVNGTSLYAEVRGSGPAVLVVHAGGEDAEQWRPVAERLAGFTVVTYDRRGTLRSGRDDWPGRGSAQHADDAAGLLDALGLGDVVVLGASSGGIPALQLALRHPRLVRRVLVFEPGLFRHVPGGEQLQELTAATLAQHLATHPRDWAGAWGAFRQAAQQATKATLEAPLAADEPDFLAPPPGMAWYTEREDMDAEALVVDDIPILTREVIDEPALATSSVDFRFAYGTTSLPIFRQIVTHLAAVRAGVPDAIDGVGHGLVYHSGAAAAYIARNAAP